MGIDISHYWVDNNFHVSSHYGIYLKAQINRKYIFQYWLLVFPSNLNIMVISI